MPGRRLYRYNLGQNKMEQQTPIPTKSNMKQRKSQNVPFSHPIVGYKFHIYFVQDCRYETVNTWSRGVPLEANWDVSPDGVAFL